MDAPTHPAAPADHGSPAVPSRPVGPVPGAVTGHAAAPPRPPSAGHPRTPRPAEAPTRPPLVDLLLAAALATLSVVVYLDRALAPYAVAVAPVWLGWVLLAAIHVPLVWRRVTPTLTMAVTGIATGVYVTLGYADGVASFAVLVALYSVTAYASRADGVVAAVVSAAVITVSFLVNTANGLDAGPIGFVVSVGVFLTTWALADRTRARRELVAQLTLRAEEAERSRELATHLAVADERTRIARELHDVVAHTVSVMVVQAGAGRRVAARDPASASGSLAAIEATGRDALAELRRMVGVLRDGAPGLEADALAPQPTLDDLPELLARLREAGLPVTGSVGPVGERSPAVELSAYRIVQEALTNVLKHAGRVRRVEVRVRQRGDDLELLVRDDGRGAGLDPHDGPGVGLVGMRERVLLFGGELTAGPRVGGGYEVRAVLPCTSPYPGGVR